MLPQVLTDDLQTDFEEVIAPSKTFGIREEGERAFGVIDGVQSLTQSIYLMLSVERYEYPIYPWSVFFETNDLYGKHPSYVIAEIPRRITETLLQDDRILSTENFQFKVNKDAIHVTYVANTIFGDITLQREVNY